MTDDSGPSSEDERDVELSSITAIFPETVRDVQDPYSASIEIPVTSASSFLLASSFAAPVTGAVGTAPLTPPESDGEHRPKHGIAAAREDAAQAQQSRLNHLPPLSLRCTLPEGYPEEKSPLFQISTTPSWLPPSIVQRLIEDGARLWEELGRGPMIYDYIDHLQRAAENVFGLIDEVGVLRLDTPQDIEMALLRFDAETKRTIFERETFECGICLTPKKGSSCHRLPRCGHVFCVQCLQDFYTSCITEGDVASVKCLSPDCGKSDNPRPPAESNQTPVRGKNRRKEDPTLTPSELLSIPLQQEHVQRYVDLKRKAQLESDKNVVYCPRKWCQGPARWTRSQRPKTDSDAVDPSEESDDDEPRQWKDGVPETELPPPSERVAICENCSYAFCRVCMAGWHGELARCWPRKPAELSAEEQASADYLRLHSSPCPTCNAPCQKTMGCNHMVCFRCRTHFCYLCGAWLSESEPYKHFNTPKSSCYMRLWEMEEGDGHDVERRNFNVFDEFNDDEGEGEVEFAPMVAVDLARLPAPEPPRPAVAQRPRPRPGRHGRAAPVVEPRQRPRQRARPGREAEVARAAGPAEPERDGAAAQPEERRRGLFRFLELVHDDEEDEWDSDELDDEHDGHDGNWEIPVR